MWQPSYCLETHTCNSKTKTCMKSDMWQMWQPSCCLETHTCNSKIKTCMKSDMWQMWPITQLSWHSLPSPWHTLVDNIDSLFTSLSWLLSMIHNAKAKLSLLTRSFLMIYSTWLNCISRFLFHLNNKNFIHFSGKEIDTLKSGGGKKLYLRCIWQFWVQEN